jgi:hypothetical protein
VTKVELDANQAKKVTVWQKNCKEFHVTLLEKKDFWIFVVP